MEGNPQADASVSLEAHSHHNEPPAPGCNGNGKGKGKGKEWSSVTADEEEDWLDSSAKKKKKKEGANNDSKNRISAGAGKGILFSGSKADGKDENSVSGLLESMSTRGLLKGLDHIARQRLLEPKNQEVIHTPTT